VAEGRGTVVTLADAVKRLNKLTGLSVDEIQKLVSAQPSPPAQMITAPLYDKKRGFRVELIAALDIVFLEHIPDYPAGALTRAFRTRNLDELRLLLGDDRDGDPADEVQAAPGDNDREPHPPPSCCRRSSSRLPAAPTMGRFEAGWHLPAQCWNCPAILVRRWACRAGSSTIRRMSPDLSASACRARRFARRSPCSPSGSVG
jgi:hypothetical protein